MNHAYTFLTCLLLLLCFGCTTPAPQSKFTADSVNQLKAGMTKAEVTTVLGEPRSRSADSGGNEVWQYRKNAQEGKALKTFVNITSFGVASGVDAEFQDILTVTFKDGVVLKATYEENVRRLNTMGSN